MSFDPKAQYRVQRTERIGVGNLTRDLVAGEILTTKDIDEDVLHTLWQNEQVLEYEGPDLEALKYQPVQYVDPATGAIQRNLDEPDNNDPESQARLAAAPGQPVVDPPDEKQVFADSEEGSLRGMLDPDLKKKEAK